MREYTATITQKGWPAGTKRDMAKITRAVMHDIARSWYKKDLPKHFLASATARYGYAPRTKVHQLRKAKKFGHQKPLVYSGQMMREALRSGRISGTKKVKVRFLARALNFAGKAKRKGATYPDMKSELTAVATDEVRRFGRLGIRRAAAHYRQLNAIKKTKV